MPLYKRGKVWWFNYWHEGKHIQKSTNQGNIKVARHMEAAYHTAVVMGEVGITERKKIPPFKAAMAEFLKWSEKEHKPSTHRRYRVSAVALSRYFDRFDSLDKITPDVVEKFKGSRQNQYTTVRAKQIRKRTGQKVKPATVNRELACLRAMFNHAIKAGLSRSLANPVSQVKALPEDNEQTRVLNFEEEKKYLAAATPLLRDIATMMLQTGMRPEEVYRIQPKNVHLKGGYLVNPFGKTKAAKRRVTLTAVAREVLGRRLAASDGAYLFPHDTDSSRPTPKVNNAHDRAVRDSKVAPFRLYDLRHTWATRASESGIDLVTLAAMLGHSKINMVLRYAHPTARHQTQAMQRMEAWVDSQRG
jgi:integrase